MRRKVSVLLAAATMAAMVVASSGTASAAALSNGKGGEMANERAAFGIATAIANTTKHDSGGCGSACEQTRLAGSCTN